MSINELLALLMFLTTFGLLLAGYPVAFTLGGVALVFASVGTLFGAIDFSFLSFMPGRVFGNMTNEVLIAVPLFVFMGVMLERSKVAEELLDSMGRLFGPLRGGLGISVIVVGGAAGRFDRHRRRHRGDHGAALPADHAAPGLQPELACGAISAAGTLGQIIPPSIVLILLGDQISNAYQDAQRALGNFSPEPVSVGDLFAGALLPGLTLVGLYIVYQILMAWLKPKTSPALPAEELGGLTGWQIVKTIAKALIPPIVLIIAVPPARSSPGWPRRPKRRRWARSARCCWPGCGCAATATRTRKTSTSISPWPGCWGCSC